MKKLGFGTMRLPLLDEKDVKSIDQEQVNKMADLFLSKGFTYVDTAYPYHEGASETACRKAFTERYDRDRFVLADKMPSFLIRSAADYDRYFAEQLDRCGVSYFDYYLLHNLGAEYYAKNEEFGGFEYLKKLKTDDKARHIGFSFHDRAELLDEILTRHPDMEFVQLQINYADWENETVQARKCYEVACKHQKPIVIMEPVKGGGLAEIPDKAEQLLRAVRPDASPASWAIRYAASFKECFTVLSGMSNLKQMEDNLGYMENFQALSKKERDVLTQVTELIHQATAISCTACRYCVEGCPKDINIPAYFSAYNNLKQYGTRNFPTMYYNRSAVGHGKAGECIACGQCEAICPQRLPVMEHLRQVAEAFE